MRRSAITLLTLAFCLMALLIATAQPVKPSKGDDDPYAVIIKNNLFRPLGWKPNPPRPSYQLLGTVIVKGGPDMAIISLGGRTFYVKEGEKVGGAVLKKVEEKRAVLVEGDKEIELKIDKDRIGFLSAGGGRPSKGGPRRGEFKPEKPGEKPPPPEFKGPSSEPPIPKRIFKRIPPEIREKFKRASPEERRRMFREFVERIRIRLRGR